MGRLLRCLVPLVAAGCAALGAAAAPPIPTPIGKGPRFQPSATHFAVRAGKPVDGLRCARGAKRYGVHLELFARGLVVIVPAGIGVARPFERRGAYVYPRGCSYPVRTVDPTGVLEVDASRRLVLGDLFRIWNRPLSATRLVGFRATARAAGARVRRGQALARRHPRDPAHPARPDRAPGGAVHPAAHGVPVPPRALSLTKRRSIFGRPAPITEAWKRLPSPGARSADCSSSRAC